MRNPKIAEECCERFWEEWLTIHWAACLLDTPRDNFLWHEAKKYPAAAPVIAAKWAAYYFIREMEKM